MNKLINLSDTHYIIVGENPDKMYEGWYEVNKEIFHTSKYMLQNGCRLITHSTQPLEEVVWWERETRKSKLGFDKIKPLSLSEVEEAVYGYSVEKMAYDRAVERNWHPNSLETRRVGNEIVEAVKFGFKAHQELVKDKLFTLDDMRKAIYTAHSDGRLYTKAEKKQYTVEQYIDFLLQTLHPKTEWDVEFIDNKIKLV